VEVGLTKKELGIVIGLRALAILLIITDHFFFMSNIYTTQTFPYTFFRDGMNGIFIIFICEAFVVTRSVMSIKESDVPFSLIKFYFKRALIITPSLYIYLLTVKYTGLFNMPVTDESFYSALTFMFNYVGKPHQNVLMHFWAFGAEETFLFFAVPIVVFFRRSLAVKIFTFIALFSIFARGITFYYFTDPSQFDWWTYMQTHLHLFGLSFGVIIALTKDSFKFNTVFSKFKVHWAALTVLILVSPYLETKFDVPYLWLYKPIFSCIGFAVLLRYFLTYPDSFLSKGLRVAPLFWVGKIYFSLYIWQQPFTFVLFEKNKTIEGIVTNVAMSFLIGTTAYYCVERSASKFANEIK
jgi:peptidoglycan/LPS O-acetylase OafA/YrhL